MPVYIVTYDFKQEPSDADRKRTRDAILKMDAVQLSESTYAVSTSLAATDLYDRVREALDENDWLYVVTLKEGAANRRGWHKSAVIDWMKEKLR